MSWIAIVPVKGTRDAKSRLDPIRARTRLAFALDTVAALRAVIEVRDVFVITGDHGIGHAFSALGASVLHEGRGDGDPLNRAIRQGLAAARTPNLN